MNKKHTGKSGGFLRGLMLALLMLTATLMGSACGLVVDGEIVDNNYQLTVDVTAPTELVRGTAFDVGTLVYTYECKNDSGNVIGSGSNTNNPLPVTLPSNGLSADGAIITPNKEGNFEIRFYETFKYGGTGWPVGYFHKFKVADPPMQAEPTLTITTPPAKTAYTAGEKLDLAGMVLTFIDEAGVSVTYVNAASVTRYTFSPANGAVLAVGDTILTATHTASGKTATLPLSVTAPVIPPTVTLGQPDAPGIRYASFSVSASEDCNINVFLASGNVVTPADYSDLVALALQQAKFAFTEGVEFDFNDLAPNTTYTMFAYGVNRNGIGSAIERLVFTTNEKPERESSTRYDPITMRKLIITPSSVIETGSGVDFGTYSKTLTVTFFGDFQDAIGTWSCSGDSRFQVIPSSADGEATVILSASVSDTYSATITFTHTATGERASATFTITVTA